MEIYAISSTFFLHFILSQQFKYKYMVRDLHMKISIHTIRFYGIVCRINHVTILIHLDANERFETGQSILK